MCNWIAKCFLASIGSPIRSTRLRALVAFAQAPATLRHHGGWAQFILFGG